MYAFILVYICTLYCTTYHSIHTGHFRNSVLGLKFFLHFAWECSQPCSWIPAKTKYCSDVTTCQISLEQGKTCCKFVVGVLAPEVRKMTNKTTSRKNDSIVFRLSYACASEVSRHSDLCRHDGNHSILCT